MTRYSTRRQGKWLGELREQFVRDTERYLNQRIGKWETAPWPRRYTPAGKCDEPLPSSSRRGPGADRE